MPATKDLEDFWRASHSSHLQNYLKFPHKRRRYKFREAVSRGGHTGSERWKPPDQFKQKKIVKSCQRPEKQ